MYLIFEVNAAFTDAKSNKNGKKQKHCRSSKLQNCGEFTKLILKQNHEIARLANFEMPKDDIVFGSDTPPPPLV